MNNWEDHVSSYGDRMRKANRINYSNPFRPYCSRVGNFKSESVDPCDDNCRSYIHFRLRIYGTGDSCIIVPGWVVNRCYKRL